MELVAAKEAQIQALKQQLAAKDAELKAKDAELQAKDAELTAKDAEIGALKRRIAPGGPRLLLQRLVRGCTWRALASHGNILTQVLAFVFTPCLSKLWTLSRSVHVDLERSWGKALDLSAVGKAPLFFHSTKELQDFLAQPRWKTARSLRLPHSWSNNCMLTIALLRQIKQLFPELQDFDLLPYQGGKWTKESRRRVFSESFASLQSLKLELYSYEDLPMLTHFPVLRSLHIKLPLTSVGTRCEGFLGALGSLTALEELRLLGRRDGHNQQFIIGDQRNDLAKLLCACPGLRVLEVVPMVELRWESLIPMAAHSSLQSLALYVSPRLRPDDLNTLSRSHSLKRLRMVRQQHLDSSMPLLPLPLSNRTGAQIKAQLDVISNEELS